MADKQRLYVYETLRSVVTSWVVPDALMAGRFRWIKDMYNHPEVEIFVGKSPTCRRRKLSAVSQAIMHALQGEKIAISTLQYVNKRSVYNRKKREVSKKQPRLL